MSQPGRREKNQAKWCSSNLNLRASHARTSQTVAVNVSTMSVPQIGSSPGAATMLRLMETTEFTDRTKRYSEAWMPAAAAMT